MRKGFGVVVFAGLLLSALPAWSTVLLFLDIPQLTQKSTVVIQGQVESQRVVRGKEYIWTDSYVRVTETLKGKLATGKVVIMRQLGGETPTLGMKVDGMARFKRGEKVLVFARSLGGQLYVPVGACLGKFSVYTNSKGVQRVKRDLSSTSFGRFDSSGKFTVNDSLSLADEADMTHAALVKKIAASASKGGAR